MLAVLILWIFATGRTLEGGVFSIQALTTVGVLIALVILVIGPRAVSGLQRYMVVNHRHSASLRLLGTIDVIRRTISQGGALLRQHGAALFVLSLLIWALELAAAALFALHVAAPALASADVLLLTRAAQEWRLLFGGAGDPALVASAAAGLLVLLAVWVPAVYLYLPRLAAEPLRRVRAETTGGMAQKARAHGF